MSSKYVRKTATYLLASVPLLPIAVMARPVLRSATGTQSYAGAVLGLGATLCLLGCLAVTPISWVTNFKTAAFWRKWLGLCVFFTGATGAAVALIGARLGSDSVMRLSGQVQEWTGTLAVLILLPLAVISNLRFQKRLGSYWKVWQKRLTWAVWAIIAFHIFVLSSWQVEIAFLASSVPLIAVRLPVVRKDIAKWRKTGFMDSARWWLGGLLAGLFSYGFVVLSWTEVMVSVGASRLT